MKYILFAAAIAFSSTASLAQSFGIRPGMPISELQVLSTTPPGVFEVKPPVKHPDFEGYFVVATPETGVCKVTAMSKMIGNDASGIVAQRKFADIASQLTSRYGDSILLDHLVSNSTLTKPEDFTAGIFKSERTYVRAWRREVNSNLPQETKAILLLINAAEPGVTSISLFYDFTNLDRCEALLSAADASKL